MKNKAVFLWRVHSTVTWCKELDELTQWEDKPGQHKETLNSLMLCRARPPTPWLRSWEFQKIPAACQRPMGEVPQEGSPAGSQQVTQTALPLASTPGPASLSPPWPRRLGSWERRISSVCHWTLSQGPLCQERPPIVPRGKPQFISPHPLLQIPE